MNEILKALIFIIIGIGITLCYMQYDLIKFQEVNQSCYDQGFDFGTLIGDTGICGYYTSRKPKSAF